MAIPDYQTIMLPLLQLASDGEEHPFRKATEDLANFFGLTDAERSELLPSGTNGKFYDRVHWARTYLVKAGLLDASGRGLFAITERGTRLIATNPAEITADALMEYPEFVSFKDRSSAQSPGQRATGTHQSEAAPDAGVLFPETPAEALESSYQFLSQELAKDLLERVRTCDPAFFERLVVDLLLAMGYGGSRAEAGRALGQTGDGGVDGVISQDALGLEAVYIQAKRWGEDKPVGPRELRDFVGALVSGSATKGVFVTTSRFTDGVPEYLKTVPHRIALVDGDRLAQLMVEHGIGVAKRATYVVKGVDADYFEPE